MPPWWNVQDDTGQAISSLKAGDVRPVMITGDNAECGNYIASKCGMLNPDSRVLLGKLGDDGHLTWGDISPMSRETGLRKKEGTISTSELLSEDNLPELQVGGIHGPRPRGICSHSCM